MPALEGRVLCVREPALLAVGLIRRRDDDLPDRGRPTYRFEKTPGSLDIGLKSRQRAAIRDTHNCLSGEMKDGFDLVLGERPLEKRYVLHAAVNDVDTFG